MPEVDLRQPGFKYSASGSFTKNKERIQKFAKEGDLRYIYIYIYIHIYLSIYIIYIYM